MPILIGLAGKKRAGKDYAASIIHEIAPKYGYFTVEKIAFADALKHMVNVGLNISFKQMQDQELKEMVDPRYGKTPREILQTLGTEWGRNTISQTIWLTAFQERLRHTVADVVVVPDVRFDNEANLIRELGGYIAKIVPDPKKHTGDTDSHVSEAGITVTPKDFIVPNHFKPDFKDSIEAVFTQTIPNVAYTMRGENYEGAAKAQY